METRQRIQKVLAAAGYGSRRACEELVREGRVRVNGAVVDQLPILIDPRIDEIRIDDRKYKPARLVYFLLNKPKGVLCTNNDPAGRVRAVDLLPTVKQRVFPVGRLDVASTGLLLMTNDGELAEHLTHPRYGIEKTYEALIRGRLSDKDSKKLTAGVWMSEGKTQPASITVLYRGREQSRLQIKLREGRNRQVRRMLAGLGHRVLTLKRTRLGSLTIKGLSPGSYRELTAREVRALKNLQKKMPEIGNTRRPSRSRRKTPRTRTKARNTRK